MNRLRNTFGINSSFVLCRLKQVSYTILLVEDNLSLQASAQSAKKHHINKLNAFQVYPFQRSVGFNIDTSHLIYFANQRTCFYWTEMAEGATGGVLQKDVHKNFWAETPTQVFSCEICKIFKNIYLEEHQRTTASEIG